MSSAIGFADSGIFDRIIANPAALPMLHSLRCPIDSIRPIVAVCDDVPAKRPRPLALTLCAPNSYHYGKACADALRRLPANVSITVEVAPDIWAPHCESCCIALKKARLGPALISPHALISIIFIKCPNSQPIGDCILGGATMEWMRDTGLLETPIERMRYKIILGPLMVECEEHHIAPPNVPQASAPCG